MKASVIEKQEHCTEVQDEIGLRKAAPDVVSIHQPGITHHRTHRAGSGHLKMLQIKVQLIDIQWDLCIMKYISLQKFAQNLCKNR